MDRRLLILMSAGMLIAGLTAWRHFRPERVLPTEDTSPTAATTTLAVPPSFQLPDQRGYFVNFDRYRTRQGVVVVFFSADKPAHEDPVLTWLREHYSTVKQANYEVLGISTQTGATIRNDAENSGIDWPFPILHDIHLRLPEPAPVHHLWSRVDSTTNTLLTGTFLIDQSGLTPHQDHIPLPLRNPILDLERQFP